MNCATSYNIEKKQKQKKKKGKKMTMQSDTGAPDYAA